MPKVDVTNVVTTRPGLPASPFAQTGSPQVAVPLDGIWSSKL
jgi:hypothetical protein